MSEAAVADPSISQASNEPGVSSNSIVRTPEQITQGLAEAKERFEKQYPNDVAKPVGESKLPNDPDTQLDDKGNPPKQESKVEDKEEFDTELNPYNVPTKYLNADGTPDYERLSKAVVESQKLLGKKGFSNVNASTELTYKPGEGKEAVPAEQLKEFQEKAFKAGMTKEQFQTVMSEFESIQSKMTLDSKYTLPSINDKDRIGEIIKELKTHFGGNDEYVSGVGRAQAAVNTYLPSQYSVHDPVFNHPAVIALLAAVGSELGEGSITTKNKDGAASSSSSLRSPAEIRALPEYKGKEQFYEEGEIKKWYEAKYDKKR